MFSKRIYYNVIYKRNIDQTSVIYEQYSTELYSIVYMFEIPSSLGLHEIEVTTINNDNDWIGDKETSYNSDTINIVDDDTTPPDIIVEYVGTGTDQDSGYFSWTISDSDDGIGGDEDSGFSWINVSVRYISTEGLADFSLTISNSDTGTWDLPSSLGYYSLGVYAIDNDDDRLVYIDMLDSYIVLEQTIIDDDITQPTVTNLAVNSTLEFIYISFNASDDESGIGTINLIVDNENIIPVDIIQDGTFYQLICTNDWIMDNGTHKVIVEVLDADDDRPNDSSSQTIEVIFNTTLDEMYRYVPE